MSYGDVQDHIADLELQSGESVGAEGWFTGDMSLGYTRPQETPTALRVGGNAAAAAAAEEEEEAVEEVEKVVDMYAWETSFRGCLAEIATRNGGTVLQVPNTHKSLFSWRAQPCNGHVHRLAGICA